MSTPISPLSQESYTSFSPETPVVAPPSAPDPDNPPWGVFSAALLWLASMFVLGLIPFFAITVYLSYRKLPLTQETMQSALTTDPQGILTSIASVIPSHLLTLALAWALVTGFGKRSFREALGWHFGERFGFWTSALVAVSLFALGILILSFAGGAETDIDQIVGSSAAARFTTAFLATATAPLVEEVIYRGVLYSALQRAMGALWAIVGVSTLFALVHTFQYRNNLGVIATITILSFTLTYVRARTGRLLPCYVIHLVFNAVQSAIIVLQYFYPSASGQQKTGMLQLLLAPALAHVSRGLVY